MHTEMYRGCCDVTRRVLAEASRRRLSCRPFQRFWTPSARFSPSRCPSFIQFSQFASKGGPPRRGGPPSTVKKHDDDVDDFEVSEEEEDDPDDFDLEPETFNLLHQGKKPHEKSRKDPLPLYKAREMVDYHLKKNRIDGLEVILDSELEEKLRRTAYEKFVDFHKRCQAAFNEIDAAYKKAKQEKEERKKKKLQISRKESEKATLEAADAEKEMNIADKGEGKNNDEASMGSLKETESHSEKDSHLVEGSTKEDDSDDDDVKEGEEVTSAAVSADPAEEFENIVKEVFGEDAEIDSKGEKSVEDGSEEGVLVAFPEVSTGDDVSGFDYDKWAAYLNEERAKREEEMKRYPTLRWQTRVVLGPGKAWHPANRKVKVSVYVHELGLSKYAKMRLMALAGGRYNSTKDEVTIVSERYQQRYENQKDVLSTLLELIEEAKKADKLVNDARINYYKEQKLASKLQGTVQLSY